VTYFKVRFWHLNRGTEEQVRITCLLTEIRTWDLQNTKQECESLDHGGQ